MRVFLRSMNLGLAPLIAGKVSMPCRAFDIVPMCGDLDAAYRRGVIRDPVRQYLGTQTVWKAAQVGHRSLALPRVIVNLPAQNSSRVNGGLISG
jgi:hypothetical protein